MGVRPPLPAPAIILNSIFGTSQSRELPGDLPQECRVSASISAPKPRWILQEPMQPLHPSALHECSAIANASGVKIECRADADQKRNIKPLYVSSHKALLPGRANAHPNNMRAA